ncbi:MAG TPA: 2-C-methyl-D-erythritol 4-phosphate cytidylyltransferase, partial [Phycicoccus sp.]|nr:2-C-methyl-D-erythritol 4-phosphate cytidylyltransferase [Phycicoccus sp.]
MSDADAPTGRVGVVIVAGGSGSRLGAAEPKAFVRVAGRTLLSYAVERVAQVPGLASLVMVAPATHLDAARADLIPLASADLVAVGARSAEAAVVAGGAERSDSVRIGLERLDPACDLIVIHDAARCLTPVAVFERVIAAVRGGAAGAQGDE